MLATLGENAEIARACFIKPTIGQNSSELSTSRAIGLWEVDRDLGDVQPVGITQDDPSARHVLWMRRRSSPIERDPQPGPEEHDLSPLAALVHQDQSTGAIRGASNAP